MKIKIVQESAEAFPEHGVVPIRFRVESRFRVEPVRAGLGGWTLTEEVVHPPYLKDYDADEEEDPSRWLHRWDTSNWGVFAALDGDRRLGGAVVAWKTPDLHMLEGGDELAALWDIRVGPERRREVVGSALFQSVVDWAQAKKCRWLKVETQNINLPACRFYARQGCELRAIHRDAYHELPDEVQLLWYKDL